jgi:hypothetical protein
MPSSTKDVSTIVTVLTNNQCPFGMSSGKHSAYRKSNAVEEGVTVDFGTTLIRTPYTAFSSTYRLYEPNMVRYQA